MLKTPAVRVVQGRVSIFMRRAGEGRQKSSDEAVRSTAWASIYETLPRSCESCEEMRLDGEH